MLLAGRVEVGGTVTVDSNGVAGAAAGDINLSGATVFADAVARDLTLDAAGGAAAGRAFADREDRQPGRDHRCRYQRDAQRGVRHRAHGYAEQQKRGYQEQHRGIPSRGSLQVSEQLRVQLFTDLGV